MAHHNEQKGSYFSKIIGSGIAGFFELILFHPVDTISKRLMSNQQKLVGGSWAVTAQNLNGVIFASYNSPSVIEKYLSLFSGISFALAYKVSQRVYKFGGQPIVHDLLERKLGRSFGSIFGDKHGKVLLESTAGALIGIGEVILLPFDVLKIMKQTNPKALEGRTTYQIFRQEKLNLYRGSLLTVARNAPGSFFLFGGSAFIKEKVFRLENYRDASLGQHFVASAFGAICSIIITNPFDVIKTRIQNKPFDKPTTGLQVTKEILINEGPHAFMKGLTPKLLTTSPKLIFSFTIAQYLIGKFEKLVLKKKS